MRKVILLLFLSIPVVTNATNYYLATTGSDKNSGTITQPFATWNYAFNKLSAGDILYVRGGTYTGLKNSNYGATVSGKNGTSSNLITVINYQNEVPILDCAGLKSSSGENYGIYISGCQYWHFKGLTITNVNENTNHSAPGKGWELGGCKNITIEQCVVHGCGQGFAFGGSNDYIYFTNCDSYENADQYQNGDLCNGFNINVGSGAHIFYEGCRAWKNSDDGFDCYGADGYISFINCWAFENGPWKGGDENGNGAGFKTGSSHGTAESGVQRTLINCLSFNNHGIGFDESMDGATSLLHHVYNNVSYNGDVGYALWASGQNDIIRNNISYKEVVQNNGFGNNIVDHNSWQNGLVVTDADFVDLNSTGVKGERNVDGSLPVLNYLRLSPGSHLIDAGVDVGLPYGGKAPDLGAFETGSVKINPVPVFVSAVVENATPSKIDITFSLTLANITPDNSAFNVKVNSVATNVVAVSISGNKVQLTLASDIKFNDIVTVSYTRPANKPLQTAAGGIASSISAKSITNNIISPTKNPTTEKIQMTVYPNPVHQIINILFDYSGTFSIQDATMSSQIIRIFDFSGKLFIEKLLEAGILNIQIPINLKPGIYIVQMLSGGLILATEKIIVN
jgi:uncharacterized repeat protein (TIGR02059 family)